MHPFSPKSTTTSLATALAAWRAGVRCALAMAFLLLTAGMALAQQDTGRPLVVGSEVDYPPFAIGDTDETAGGFTVDLWKAVAAEQGLKYTIRVRPFGQILDEFKAGKIDVLINLAQSDERRAFADFSVPHVIALATSAGAYDVLYEKWFGVFEVREVTFRQLLKYLGPVAIVFLIFLGFLLVRQREREKSEHLLRASEAQLRELNANLEHLVAERTGELRASEAQFRSLTENSPDMILRFDRQFRHLYGNPAVEANTGFSPAAMRGKTDFEVGLPPALVEQSQAQMRRVFETGRSVEFEWTLPSPMGDRILLTRYVPETGEDGRVETVLAIVSDITGRKLAGDALRESEERLRVIVDSVQVGLVVHDAQTQIQTCNRAACRLLGYGENELLGKPADDSIWQFVKEDGSPMTPPEYPVNRVLAARQSLRNCLAGIRHANEPNATSWVLVNADPIFNAQGQVKQVIVAIMDITPRRQAETALIESESNWRIFFTESADGMIAADPVTRRFRRVNQQICRMLGYAESELLAMSVADLHAPADVPVVLDAFQRMVRGELKAAELPVVRKDGSVLSLEVTGAVLVVAGEHLLLGAFRDITDRKRAEEELRRHREQLEHLVAERTNDLKDSRMAALNLMQDAQRQEKRVAAALVAQRALAAQLEEANQELESFSYSVSHDLRAPLRHVQGYVEMLKTAAEGQLSDKARRYLQSIHDASLRMGQLIDDLLAFSRMGRAEMHERPVEMDKLMQETLRGLDLLVQGRNIEWKIAPLPRAVGDRSLLLQVLANLVGNAVKYTSPRDPARIEVGCAGEEEGRIVFCVRDNGVGFDMQYAHKLFAVFQRLHRAEEFEGTGIGLANVQRIIARHGGRVWAESKPGEGATFYFTLKPAPAG